MSKYQPYDSGNVEINRLQERLRRALQDVSTLLDQLGTAQGSILFRSATGWKVLAPGVAGQHLTTNGPGADPSWS